MQTRNRARKSGRESLERRDLLTAQMVLDVNSEDVGINPSFLTSFKDEIYFAANVGDVPEAEIWKTDGTVEGTRFAASLGLGKVVRMQALDEHLIIVKEIAGEQLHSTTGLFATDGTQAGTVELVRALDAENPYSFSLSELITSDGVAYVRAGAGIAGSDSSHFHTVFSTDGTLEGTRKHEPEQIEPAALTLYEPHILKPILAPTTNAENLTLIGDRLFFTASQQDVGNELWEFDREGGAQLFADLNLGEESSFPSQLVQHKGNLFFIASDVRGIGVWVLEDDSDAPQRLVTVDDSTELIEAHDGILIKSQAVGSDSFNISRIDDSLNISLVGTIPAEYDNLTWFANSLLYTRRIPGVQLLEMQTGTEFFSFSIGDEPGEFFHRGEQLVFASTTERGRELWTFDGEQVAELDTPFRSGSITTDFEYPDYFSIVMSEGASNGTVLVGYTEGAARELTALEIVPVDFDVRTIVSDGTADGTRIIEPRKMFGWNGRAHEVGGEIFLLDSWVASQFWNLKVDENAWRRSSFADLKAADDRFNFVDADSTVDVIEFEGQLISPRPQRIRVEPHGQGYPFVTISHGDFFLRSQDESYLGDDHQTYAELYVRRPDRTVEPVFTEEQLSRLGITSMPHNRNLYTGTPPGRLFAANDLIYFVAGTEAFGRELWQSDGTLEGTKMVRDIMPGPRSSSAELLGVSGDTLFFMANDGIHGRELWSVTPGEVDELFADLNDDGEVSFADFLIFSQDYGRTANEDERLPSDFNGDGFVGFDDFLLLSDEFGKRSA